MDCPECAPCLAEHKRLGNVYNLAVIPDIPFQTVQSRFRNPQFEPPRPVPSTPLPDISTALGAESFRLSVFRRNS